MGIDAQLGIAFVVESYSDIDENEADYYINKEEEKQNRINNAKGMTVKLKNLNPDHYTSDKIFNVYMLFDNWDIVINMRIYDKNQYQIITIRNGDKYYKWECVRCGKKFKTAMAGTISHLTINPNHIIERIAPKGF